jgi:hypothetical protein
MHDTWGTRDMRCLAMERKPRIKVMDPIEARASYDARQCPVCMPFKVNRVVVVEQRRGT